MDRNDWLAERLEAQRTRMHALATNRREDQEIAMPALHLLQISLV